MKTVARLTLILTMLHSINSYSQDFDRELKVIEAYQERINAGKEGLKKRIQKLEAMDSSDAKLIDKKKNQLENYLFNNKMLNILFADEVGSFFNNSDNLLLQEFYASLSADDKSLNFGFTVNNRGKNKLKPLNMVYNFGLKVKAKNKFASFFENGSFNDESDLGISFNISNVNVFSGAINFTSIRSKGDEIIYDRGELIKSYRENLYDSYQKKIDAYIKETLPKKEDSIKSILKQMDGYKNKPDVAQIYTEQAEKFYQKLAEDEITYLKKNKAYRFISSDWVSFDGFAPVTKTKYNILQKDNSGSFEEETFIPWKTSLSWNYFRKYSNNVSYFVAPKLSIQNNNNILVEDITAKTLIVERQTFTNGSGIDKTESVYEDYQEFVTLSFGGEVVIFFNKTIGFSPSFEQNIGEYKALNWKLGIPISLKDKEGKPKVNFELQWKEVKSLSQSNHLVGISASFLFGKFIN